MVLSRASSERNSLGVSTLPCTGEIKGRQKYAFSPERPSAVFLLGRMGDWTCDRNREPAHLAEHSVLGLEEIGRERLRRVPSAETPPRSPHGGVLLFPNQLPPPTFFMEPRIVLRVIVLAAEHLAVERKGRGYFITPLSGVGSCGFDNDALGKHGLRNAPRINSMSVRA